MERITEIQARLAEINTEIDTAEGEELTALETESRSLLAELEGLQQSAQARQKLRDDIARGAAVSTPVSMKNPAAPAQPTAEERAAAEFGKTRRMSVDADQARATLISSGKLVQPTKIDGINDIPGAKVTGLIDLVKVENCVGMGMHRIAFVNSDAGAAANQTEGQAIATANLGNFDYVDIKPESVAVLDYISKQAKKQTNLQYAAKVRAQAMLALRKKAATIVTTALKEDEKMVLDVEVTPGKIDATTLRKLALSYGDDESVMGGAHLVLHKTDLIAFGDVRGTNEKKAIYTITPNPSNPNTGTISEGGLTVPYVLNSGLTPLSTATEGAGRTMFYGNLQAVEIDLFSDYEIAVSEDFAFDKLMDAIRGDVELGAGLNTKNAVCALTV